MVNNFKYVSNEDNLEATHDVVSFEASRIGL